MTPELARITGRLVDIGVVVTWIAVVGVAVFTLALLDDVRSVPLFLTCLTLIGGVTEWARRHDWTRRIASGDAPRDAELWATLLVLISLVNVTISIPRAGSWLYYLVIAGFFGMLLPARRALRVALLSVAAAAVAEVAAGSSPPVVLTAALGVALVAVVGHGTADVVGRVVAESSRRGRMLATVAQSARAIATLETETVVERVADAAMQLGFDVVAITRRTGDHHRIVVERTTVGPVFREAWMPMGDMVRRVVDSRETIARDGYLAGPSPNPDLRAHGVDAVVVSPVVVDGAVEALLVGGRLQAPFDPPQVEAFTLMGELLARSLANARRYEQERAAVRTLDELARLKDDFISNISHELRTPITVILGALHTLDDHGDRLDAETRQNLRRRAIANAEGLMSTLEALLEFAQVDDPGSPGPAGLQTVDVAALVRRSWDRLASLLSDHRVRVHAADAAPVRAAAHQLERVVDNLLLNAARHTPPGTEVEVRVRVDHERVRVEVADDGPGVPAEDLPRLTERFFRGGEGNTRATRGLGLGLALVQTILEAHDSALDIASVPGEGSRFAFELPRADRV